MSDWISGVHSAWSDFSSVTVGLWGGSLGGRLLLGPLFDEQNRDPCEKKMVVMLKGYCTSRFSVSGTISFGGWMEQQLDRS